MPLPKKLLRAGFFLLYNHLAFTYDAVAWLVSLGAWARWRRAIFPYLRPGPTLELAFGTGGLFADLCDAGRRPVGVDLSPFMARLAARRLRRRGLPLALARARAQALPFPAERFANVVATFPTDYIFDPVALSEVHRVLANGGRLLIVTQGHLHAPPPVAAFIEWLYAITGQRDSGGPDALKRFRRAGFKAAWERAEVEGSAATLIVARKTQLTIDN